MKKLTALLLALLMAFSVLTVSVFAEEAGEETPAFDYKSAEWYGKTYDVEAGEFGKYAAAYGYYCISSGETLTGDEANEGGYTNSTSASDLEVIKVEAIYAFS